jgi:hypothetical protein
MKSLTIDVQPETYKNPIRPQDVYDEAKRYVEAITMANHLFHEKMTVLEFAERIIEITGSDSKIVFEGLPVDDPKVQRPDINRAKEVLGWEPKVRLQEGLGFTNNYFEGIL